MAEAGYDGVDLDAEPDRIDPRLFDEVASMAASLGLKIPALICAWGGWHAGEVRDLAWSEERGRAGERREVRYTKGCVELAAGLDGPPGVSEEIAAVPPESEYPVTSVPRPVLRRNFVKSTREIGAYAAPRGVRVAIVRKTPLRTAVPDALPLRQQRLPNGNA